MWSPSHILSHFTPSCFLLNCPFTFTTLPPDPSTPLCCVIVIIIELPSENHFLLQPPFFFPSQKVFDLNASPRGTQARPPPPFPGLGRKPPYSVDFRSFSPLN